jgi:hypothetical protein
MRTTAIVTNNVPQATFDMQRGFVLSQKVSNMDSAQWLAGWKRDVYLVVAEQSIELIVNLTCQQER